MAHTQDAPVIFRGLVTAARTSSTHSSSRASHCCPSALGPYVQRWVACRQSTACIAACCCCTPPSTCVGEVSSTGAVGVGVAGWVGWSGVSELHQTTHADGRTALAPHRGEPPRLVVPEQTSGRRFGQSSRFVTSFNARSAGLQTASPRSQMHCTHSHAACTTHSPARLWPSLSVRAPTASARSSALRRVRTHFARRRWCDV